MEADDIDAKLATGAAVNPARAVRSLVDHARSLRNQRRWAEALAEYDEIVRRFGDEPAIAVQDEVGWALLGRAKAAGRRAGPAAQFDALDQIAGRFRAAVPPLRVWAARALWRQACELGGKQNLDRRLAVFDELAALFDDNAPPYAQVWTAKALLGKARALRNAGRAPEGDHVLHELVERFRSSDHPHLQLQVAQALVIEPSSVRDLFGPDWQTDVYDEVMRRADRAGGAHCLKLVALALQRKAVSLNVSARAAEAQRVYDELATRFLKHQLAPRLQLIALDVLRSRARTLGWHGRDSEQRAVYEALAQYALQSTSPLVQQTVVASLREAGRPSRHAQGSKNDNPIAILDLTAAAFATTEQRILLLAGVEALMVKASFLVSSGKAGSALALYDEAEQRTAGRDRKRYRDIRRERLGTLRALGRVEEALAVAQSLYQDCLASFDVDMSHRRRFELEEALLLIGACLSDLDRHDSALAMFEEATQRLTRPDTWYVLRYRRRAQHAAAATLRRLGRGQEALVTYKVILAELTDPSQWRERAQTSIEQAHTLAELGRPDAAQATFERALTDLDAVREAYAASPGLHTATDAARAALQSVAILNELGRDEAKLPLYDEVLRLLEDRWNSAHDGPILEQAQLAKAHTLRRLGRDSDAVATLAAYANATDRPWFGRHVPADAPLRERLAQHLELLHWHERLGHEGPSAAPLLDAELAWLRARED